jgi:ABC-type dipeptide/oligopeptide/nickel transport system permease subunit
LLSRLLAGARTSLSVALAATVLSLIIGVGIGSLAALAGGHADAFLMRLTDLFLALPGPLILIAVMAAAPEPRTLPLVGSAEEPAVLLCFLVLGLLGWGDIARMARAGVLEARHLEYVQAARATGAGPIRVLGLHLIPPALRPVWVLASASVGTNILAESWLSFLGIGVQPPRPSWGSMIAGGTQYLLTAPWICIFPGVALTLSVLGFHLLGDLLSQRAVARPAGDELRRPGAQPALAR